MDAFAEAIVADAGKIVVGDPAVEETRMGPLVNETQRAAALEHIGRLKSEAEILTGADIPRVVSGADAGKGAFLAPTILRCADPQGATSIHEVEVFGPCLTLMPYRSLDEGLSLVMRGGGALALSLFSDDAAVQAQAVSRLAPWHGRVLVADSAAGKAHTGHAIVMPQCTHGGPGHAGGGEELGGLRGLRLHMQRTAVQGSGELIGRLAEDSAEASL
jgi:acyl-CoA reductase-like NAD-dependent aldehyde dehydrogenase